MNAEQSRTINMLAWRHAWLWFYRGILTELKLPLLTFALAAAVTSGIVRFSQQLNQTLSQAAGTALGADLVIQAPAPLPPILAAAAKQHHLKTTTVTTFPTVAEAGKRFKLASIRAVGPGYPLRGSIQLRAQSRQPSFMPTSIPGRNNVWVSPSLLASLSLRTGEHIRLGKSVFTVRASLAQAPGTELNLASIAPTIIMNRADLIKTGLAGKESRAHYQVLLAGTPQQLKQFRVALQRGHLLPGDAEIRTAADTVPAVRGPINTARNFLRLAALATLLLAAAALFQGTNYHLAQQRQTIAILKTLGATIGHLRILYSVQLLWLSLAASALGGLGAWGLSAGLDHLALHWLPLGDLPPDYAALWIAPAIVAILATGLWLFPLLRIPGANIQALLRLPTDSIRISFVRAATALATTAGLIFWLGSTDPQLTFWVIGIGATITGLLALAGWGCLIWLNRVPASIRPAWRLGISNLARQPGRSLSELIAFGAIITIVMFLTGVRHDLLNDWQRSFPTSMPDHFVINIQSGQRQAVQRALYKITGNRVPLYRMVRARLKSINGTPVKTWAKRLPSQRADHLLRREQTLSSRRHLGDGNYLVKGHWWQRNSSSRKEVSADANWAKHLKINLGDKLTFSVADQTISLKVSSLRHVNWESFKPNFFLVTPPGSLKGYPATWITAVKLGSHADAVEKLLTQFPNLTPININFIVGAIRRALREASLALTGLFGFALVAAVLLLLSTLQASRSVRIRQLAILQVLGSRRSQLAISLAAEFGVLGIVAGTLGGTIAAVAGYAIGTWLFRIPANIDFTVVLLGAFAGMFIIGGIGLSATLRLTRLPILRWLR